MATLDEAELRRRVQAGSQDAGDYCCLAETLRSQRRFEAAVRTYEQALGLPLPPFDRARVLAGFARLLHDGYGRSEQTLSLAHEAVTLLAAAPETAAVWALRGMSQAVAASCVAFSNPEGGRERARRALADLVRAVDAGVARASAPLAEMHLLLAEPEEAVIWGERYMQGEPDEADRVAFSAPMARAYRLSGQAEEAERTLTEALFRIELCKHAAAGLYHEQGLLYRGAGRHREARVALERALGAVAAEDRPQSVEVRLSLGELCYDEGDFAEAVRQFEEVLNLVPADIAWRRYTLVWLGRSRVELGACEQARECFAEVLASPEATAEEQTEAQRGALYAEAQQRYQAGDFRAAAKAYRKIVDASPEDDDFRRTMLLWLADCCMRTDDPAGARACYEEILASPGATAAEKERALQDLASLPAGKKWVQ